MTKEEFKQMLKELCKSGEITISLEPHNDGEQWLTLKVDGEIICEEYIEKD